MGSTTTGAVNEALYFIAALSFLLFGAIIFFLVFFAVRYRKSRSPVATELHGAPWLEVVWIVIPTFLALAMFMYGLTGYRFLRNPPAGSLEVTVHSKMWAWSFEYGNGKLVPDLVLPADTNVRLTLTSDDVLHGFYVPDYRIQVDTVPGLKTEAWLRTAQPGVSIILCTVYCGTAHSNMLAKLYVVAPEVYQDWYEGKDIDLKAAIPSLASLPGEKGPVRDLLQTTGCLSCHSLDGSKGAGPSFKGRFGTDTELVVAGETRTVKVDRAYLVEAIKEPGASIVKGYPDIMPKEDLSEDEVEGIALWLEGLK